MSWPTTPTVGDKTTIDGKQWEYMGDGVWERTDIALGEQHDRQHAMDSEDDHAPAAEADKGKWIRANPDTGKIEYVEAPVGDKYHTVNITYKLESTIQHNLNKYPAVQILDENNMIATTSVEYIDTNNVKVTFEEYFTGKIIFN